MEKPPENFNRFTPTRRTLIITLFIATSITILAIGLGISLTIRHHSPESPTTTPPAIPNTNTTRQSIWQPTVNDTWQIVLNAPLKLDAITKSVTPDVDVFDIELYTNSVETIETLHALGKRVICYFSAGTYEPYRPDSSEFEAGDLGNALVGWPDEKWLNTSSANVRSIMVARIELACQKGCDGLDPDNVDGYVSCLLGTDIIFVLTLVRRTKMDWD